MSPSLCTARAGFTLIEMMITIAILAILIGVLAPGALRFVKDVRLAGQSNDLLTDLMLARSEAVKRDVSITICGRKNNGAAACGADPQWTGGWFVVIDTDRDGKQDSGTKALKSTEPLSGGNTLTASGQGPKGAVTFTPTGVASTGALTLTLCDEDGFGRIIEVSAMGRASATKVSPHLANKAACNDGGPA